MSSSSICQKLYNLENRVKALENLNENENMTLTMKVGLLHSLTGTMALSETPVHQAALMAIDEINKNGGVKVGPHTTFIEPITKDGESDPAVFKTKAQELIDQGVEAIFGCWTSSSRKAVQEITETNKTLLFYPTQYEGEECSRYTMYLGFSPNQQSIPAVQYFMEEHPSPVKDTFLVGSDYVYPRTSNEITKKQLAEDYNQVVVGEEYLPLGEVSGIDSVLEKIKNALPTGGYIINTLNGDQNVSFFAGLKSKGLTAENGYYVMSFSISEQESESIGPENLAGHYIASKCISSLNTVKASAYVSKTEARYGNDKPGDADEAIYTAMYLWKQAAEKTKSVDTDAVSQELRGMSFDAPQGLVQIRNNNHLQQPLRIGLFNITSKLEIVKEIQDIEPKAWNLEKNFICDHSDPNKGEKYQF